MCDILHNYLQLKHEKLVIKWINQYMYQIDLTTIIIYIEY